jgi:redox-sensitive bicupin YhaK (pirin superfamily)
MRDRRSILKLLLAATATTLGGCDWKRLISPARWLGDAGGDTMTVRPVKETLVARSTTDGAGVKLRRVFGFGEVPRLDPFLLLDDFASEDPDDYIAGFPWHPHRGMETVTYMLNGRVRHEDSLGNSGVIQGGDIQWMSAGRGIVHQEMPEQAEGLLRGLQLWVNLPRKDKMTPPRYQDIPASEVPTLEAQDGATVRVLAGSHEGATGPVVDVAGGPTYLDVALGAGGRFSKSFPAGHRVIAYVLDGAGRFAPDAAPTPSRQAVVYGDGDRVEILADAPVRFILIAGPPLNEPIAWNGPIVMNTDEELALAFRQYREGTFLQP